MMDLNIPLGQGTGIREIDRTKQQTLRHKRPPPRRQPKEKEEKQSESSDRFAEPHGSEDPLTDADENEPEKAPKPRGGILDVTI